MKYLTYNDYMIMPAVISRVNHRADINPYKDGNFLPIFTAPMSTVVNLENYTQFEENNIIPIIPRNIPVTYRKDICFNENRWVAFSMGEFSSIFHSKIDENIKELKVLVDVANGHMLSLYESIKKAKEINGDRLVIMTGNIANPETYRIANESGVDYIRLGIGGGMGCITSSNTSIHTPMATLISETRKIQQEINGKTKIIADGGVRGYKDVVKAIALGADYVMIGGILASAMESAALIECERPIIKLDEKTKEIKYVNGDSRVIEGKYLEMKDNHFFYKGSLMPLLNPQKIFYGMASAMGQKDMYGEKIKTSEGCVKKIPLEYTLSQWVENMKDYLCSAMSYSDSFTLTEFMEKGKKQLIEVSENAFNAVNK